MPALPRRRAGPPLCADPRDVLTETQERFLKAILARVAAERIAEVHLFPPIRSGGVESGIAVIAASPPGMPVDAVTPARVEVHTATYRLALKGRDRGQWAFDVVAEGDAPLRTVDTVVRGVLSRSGDAGEPERLGPDRVLSLAAAWPTPLASR